MNPSHAPNVSDVSIPCDAGPLPGVLTLPNKPGAIVLFAHGSGSSRLSPRNRLVAEALHRAGLATLLFDLLTEAEARDRGNVFDIPLLARRLQTATRWIQGRAETAHLPIGYFGASTGAAAALVAAAGEPDIAAVVSLGGCPDLAGDSLPRVSAPTLLIVGGDDAPVIEMNRTALLRCTRELVIVPGAGHLFEELGTLERAALLARWFSKHLPQARTQGPLPCSQTDRTPATSLPGS